MISVSPLASPTCEDRPRLFDYISPTRLNTWLSCPLKFKIRYLEGLKEPTSPSLFLGKRVHGGLEFYYRRLQDGHNVATSEVVQRMVDTWDDAVADEGMHFDSSGEENATRQQAIGLVQTYLEQLDSTEGFPVAVESRLDCPLVDPDLGEDLGIALLGIVDLVIQLPEGPVVVDFKTAARSTAPLDITHEIQLSCYAYAFRHVFGETERELQIRSLIKTKTPKVEVHRYSPRDETHFRRLFAVIHAYLDDLQMNRFVYRPGWTCSMCSFRDTYCREWQG
jgi:CRISPR/Cas system-associated exonuclease Cas4 (RecB family)